MQLYSSVLTHYPGVSFKVSIPITAAAEKEPGDHQEGGIEEASESSANDSSIGTKMPAFSSCYEIGPGTPSKPVHFTSTAKITVRPHAVEKTVPIQITESNMGTADSPIQFSQDGKYPPRTGWLDDIIENMKKSVNGLEEYESVLENNLLMNGIETEENCYLQPGHCKEFGLELGCSSEGTTLQQNSAIENGEPDRNSYMCKENGMQVPSEVPEIKITDTVKFDGFRNAGIVADNKPDKNEKIARYLAEVDKQNKYLRDRQKYRFHIIPDGNCLYRAVSKAVYGDQAMHKDLREQTVHHIADHLDEFNPIIEGDIGEFLINAAQDGTWAGYPELLAMSQMLNINIYLTTGGSLESPTVSTMVHYLGAEDAMKTSIWLSWLSNGHYDAVFDHPVLNPEYESWCKQTQVQRKRDEELAKSMAASLSKMYIEQNGYS
uniref:OTU domain-containing protein 1 n=1 Tax=Latimeria chalumnae TaxID=7897 RepID=H3AU21_LATCH